ncbi:MAG TPA: sigma-70 family RNA polymerase sigma factor [Acetobacteraceae bacterium]|nr:sigma-70 family RNA polymerase sigma factor [Acetobacteraceae bacterium]
MSAPPGPPPPEALALLLRRVAESRDRAAYALLFGHFAPRVKAYMRKLGAADAQAEDLAQDALLAVWHKAASFDPARAGAATWVFTIARNLRIDALRRLPKGGMADADSLPEPAYDAPGADAVLDTETRDGRLRAALQTLPAEQAKLVNLAYYEDRPHAEIERLLGIPLGTVKSRLRLAMQRLRAAMEEWS